MKLVLKTKTDYQLYYLIQAAALFSVLGGLICLLLKKSSSDLNLLQFLFPLPYLLLLLTLPLLLILFQVKFSGYSYFISFLKSTAYVLSIIGIILFLTSVFYIFKADFYTPIAAINFSFSGICLQFLTSPDKKKKQSFNLFIVFPIIINSVAIAIYFFDTNTDNSTQTVAIINTCMLSLILFTGIAFLLIDSNSGSLLYNKSLKSKILRHLLPFLLVIPFTALLFKLNLAQSIFTLF